MKSIAITVSNMTNDFPASHSKYLNLNILVVNDLLVVDMPSTDGFSCELEVKDVFSTPWVYIF